MFNSLVPLVSKKLSGVQEVEVEDTKHSLDMAGFFQTSKTNYMGEQEVVERESRQRKGERWLARWTTDGGRRLTTLKTVVIVFLGHLKPDPPAVASRTKAASYRRQQLRTEIVILCQGKTARPGTWLCGRYVKEWADWLSDELG
ncbi:hypothetical protein Hdeb2414_s0020g00565881 [Helianthus debilis subsp. tardiflorus]